MSISDVGNWVVVHDFDALEKALKLAKGSYQKNLLLGFESMSGSSIKGSAKKYSYKYHVSRQHLIARVESVGIKIGTMFGNHGAKLLVVG